MQDPLKQGLKLKNPPTVRTSIYLIRMQDPLKQGLKLQTSSNNARVFQYSNARSTKTRIETLLPVMVCIRRHLFECKIH